MKPTRMICVIREIRGRKIGSPDQWLARQPSHVRAPLLRLGRASAEPLERPDGEGRDDIRVGERDKGAPADAPR